MKLFGDQLNIRPGETHEQALIRDRADRLQGQQTMLIILCVLLAMFSVGMVAAYWDLVAYCQKYGTTP